MKERNHLGSESHKMEEIIGQKFKETVSKLEEKQTAFNELTKKYEELKKNFNDTRASYSRAKEEIEKLKSQGQQAMGNQEMREL